MGLWETPNQVPPGLGPCSAGLDPLPDSLSGIPAPRRAPEADLGPSRPLEKRQPSGGAEAGPAALVGPPHTDRSPRPLEHRRGARLFLGMWAPSSCVLEKRLNPSPPPAILF